MAADSGSGKKGSGFFELLILGGIGFFLYQKYLAPDNATQHPADRTAPEEAPAVPQTSAPRAAAVPGANDEAELRKLVARAIEASRGGATLETVAAWKKVLELVDRAEVNLENYYRAQAYLHMAVAQANVGRLQEAAEDERQALQWAAPEERDEVSRRVEEARARAKRLGFVMGGSELGALIDRAHEAFDQEKYHETIQAAERLIAAVKAANVPGAGPMISEAYSMIAISNSALWKYLDALKAWQEARNHAPQDRADAIDQEIGMVRAQLGSLNEERGTRDRYVASPGLGPAGTLEGRIAVAHVFVEDSLAEAWGPRSRSQVQQSWTGVESWFKGEARRYAAGRPLEFVTRFFAIDKDPAMRRFKIEKEGDYARMRQFSLAAVRNLGSPDVPSFLRRIKAEGNATHAILLFHLNRRDRSFAFSCKQDDESCSRDGEFAFVLDPPVGSETEKAQYTVAHESLHLFGAEDLYLIRDGAEYSPDDIMNYRSRYLRDSKIEPITAFGVGIVKTPPQAPFPVGSK